MSAALKDDSDDDSWIVSSASGSGTDNESDGSDATIDETILTASGNPFDNRVEWGIASNGVPQCELHPLPVEHSGYRSYLNTKTGVYMRAVVVKQENTSEVNVHIRDTADACLADLKSLFGQDFKPKLNEAKASQPANACKPRSKPLTKRFKDGPIYNTAYAAQVIAAIASNPKPKKPVTKASATDAKQLNSAPKKQTETSNKLCGATNKGPEAAKSKSAENGEESVCNLANVETKQDKSSVKRKDDSNHASVRSAPTPVVSKSTVVRKRKVGIGIGSSDCPSSPTKDSQGSATTKRPRKFQSALPVEVSVPPCEMVELSIRIPVDKAHLVRAIIKSLIR